MPGSFFFIQLTAWLIAVERALKTTKFTILIVPLIIYRG